MDNEKESLLAEMESLKGSSLLIIVEGKKDRMALEANGLKNILVLNGPLYKVCEDVSKKTKSAAILTDLDKEGKKLYSKIKEGLNKNGVSVNDSFRNFLFKCTKLRQIEGLLSYIDSLDR